MSLAETDHVHLIGPMKSELSGSDLPSKRDCLSVLFYKMRKEKLPLAESAIIVINHCLEFWKKARIPTQHHSNCVRKLKDFYFEWRNLQKSKNRESKTGEANRETFSEQLNNLFDIAHADALKMIKAKADKKFLEEQRKPRHQDSSIEMDKKVADKETRKSGKKDQQLTKKQRSEPKSNSTEQASTSSSTSNSVKVKVDEKHVPRNQSTEKIHQRQTRSNSQLVKKDH